MKRFIFLALLTIIMTTCFSYTSWEDSVTMRDGIVLATTVITPDEVPEEGLPVILQRTPYNRDISDPEYLLAVELFGYILVSQNVRGTYDSEGEPMVFLTDGWGELQDGYDCIDWIVEQEWCNGSIGMLGASAPGMTQYMAIGANHPNLTCTVPIVAGPSMYHHVAYNNGSWRKVLVESWLSSVETPWLVDTVCNHHLYNEYWETSNLAERWDIADVPSFHVSGWYDMYTDGQIEAFTEMHDRFGNQKLLIFPWGHGEAFGTREQGDLVYPENALLSEEDILRIALGWYNNWLQGPTGILDDPPVTFYLTGDCDTDDTTSWNRFIHDDEFPPSEMVYKPFYLENSGLLDTLYPVVEGSEVYEYDPTDPSPTVGGREFVGLETGYGPKDQAPLVESRDDCVIYTTEVLNEPLTVIGKLKMVLFASSNRVDTDFAVRVTDVYPDGRSILVTDNIISARHRNGLDVEDLLTPEIAESLYIDLWSIAHVFNEGHRLRIIVTSSNYPRFEINPNTGNPFERDPITTDIATNTIYHSTSMPSHLLLPVVEDFEILDVASHTSTPEAMEISCSPNPFNSSCMIQTENNANLEIYDISGKLVKSVKNTPGSFNWRPSSNISSGLYFIKSHINGKVSSKTIIYMK